MMPTMCAVPCSPGKSDNPRVYINRSVWESRDAFHGWTGAESFRRVHSGGLPDGAVAGRPRLTVADVV